MPLPLLQHHFGKAGAHFFGIARGIDDRPMRPHRVRKSIGAETTFEADLQGYEQMTESLRPIVDKVWRHCEAMEVRGRTVTLKVKYADFTLITRSRSDVNPISDRTALEAHSLRLLSGIIPLAHKVRLLGVSLSNQEEEMVDPLRTLFDS